MTITEIISIAAKTYAKNSTAPDKETPNWIERDFKAGVEWATSDPSVLKELLGKFAEWLSRSNYKKYAEGKWEKYGRVYSDEQLCKDYLEYLNSKNENNS